MHFSDPDPLWNKRVWYMLSRKDRRRTPGQSKAYVPKVPSNPVTDMGAEMTKLACKQILRFASAESV